MNWFGPCLRRPCGLRPCFTIFTNGTDGAQPVGGLVLRSKSGNLYGTARRGTSSKHGVVFELNVLRAVAGGKWKEIVLHTFQPLIQ